MTVLPTDLSTRPPLDLAEVARQSAAAHKAEPGQVESTGLSRFADLVDVLNPLQHIPVISHVYRAITNDQISDGARYAGHALYGAAFGGPIGMSAMLGYSLGQDAVQQVAFAGSAPPLPESGPSASGGTPVDLQNLLQKATIAVPAAKPDTAVFQRTSDTVLGADTGKATERSEGGVRDMIRLLSDVGVKPSEAVISGSESDTDPEPISSAEKLEVIAAHHANRLPLDVLKALQERHADRIHAEQS
ncbi:hypothetical protein [Roseibium sp. RKSG952]|uniref:hypothetical protein n=1 Tax=Roseibium sp. RKSG952 TaxID=2529384 RepID=UPI0012BD69F7|nr:hypothetical protein [Roseibium sp. RKSG952]MTH98261.1 hypothetical protein [Roseibium sp. RKSG952]